MAVHLFDVCMQSVVNNLFNVYMAVHLFDVYMAISREQPI